MKIISEKEFRKLYPYKRWYLVVNETPEVFLDNGDFFFKADKRIFSNGEPIYSKYTYISNTLTHETVYKKEYRKNEVRNSLEILYDSNLVGRYSYPTNFQFMNNYMEFYKNYTVKQVLKDTIWTTYVYGKNVARRIRE